jgi:hypothetical protein
MKILKNAKIRGIPKDEDDIDWYWRLFDDRDKQYVGERAPIEDEEAAFQELLDSILPTAETDVEDSSEDETMRRTSNLSMLKSRGGFQYTGSCMIVHAFT